MIRADEDLGVTQMQLTRVEEALASLRRDVLPKNHRNYTVLSEGYVEQIAQLRAEIDAYRHERFSTRAGRTSFWGRTRYRGVNCL